MPLSLRHILLLPLFCLSFHQNFANAYSWQLNAPPKQCSNLSITIIGSDGLPPYRILIVPYGSTPLPNNTEVRPVIDQLLEGNTTTFSFPINYPASSQFVAVVSDAHNFGSGGTSVATQVANSDDSSCFSISNPYSPLFYLYVNPDSLLQCGPATISWDTAKAQGIPTFQGVIPGGQSFVIQESTIKNMTNGQTGFSWIPSIRAQTDFLIVGGDNRGLGTAGSEDHAIGNSGDNSCLNNLSPSSTPGTPAGAIATNTSMGTSSTSTSSSRPSGDSQTKHTALIGGIVGGVVGGLVLILLTVIIGWCLLRRSTKRRRPGPSILGDYSTTGTLTGGTEEMSNRNSRLAHYNPEPFSIYTPSTSSNNERMEWGSSVPPLSPRYGGLRSKASSTTNDRSSSAIGSGHGRVPSAVSSVLQPMRKGSLNILQHEDAGPSDPMLGAENTIELPPQYDDLRPGNLS